MYVVFAEELRDVNDIGSHMVASLETAFARIVCRCALGCHFEPCKRGWKMVLFDVGDPSQSPAPIFTTAKRLGDAQHDLMRQAVDGRLRGHVAVDLKEFLSRFDPRDGAFSA